MLLTLIFQKLFLVTCKLSVHSVWIMSLHGFKPCNDMIQSEWTGMLENISVHSEINIQSFEIGKAETLPRQAD